MWTLTTPDLEALGPSGGELRGYRYRGVIEGREDHALGQRGNAPMRYPPGTEEAVLYLHPAVKSGKSISQAGFEAWLANRPIPIGFVRDLLVDLAEGGYRQWKRKVVGGHNPVSAAEHLASKVEARTTRWARDPLVREAFKQAGSKAEYKAALLQLLPVMTGNQELMPGDSDPSAAEPGSRVFSVKVGDERLSAWRGLREARKAGLLPIHRLGGSIAALNDDDLLDARRLFSTYRGSLERLQGMFSSIFERWENRVGFFALTAVLLARMPLQLRQKMCEPVKLQL